MSKFDRHKKKKEEAYIFPHKHCARCGQMIEEALKHCPQCHQQIQQRQKKKRFKKNIPKNEPPPSIPEKIIIRKDGTILYCPSCGKKTNQEKKYCEHCGSNIEDE